jgi:hypothetical protein
MVCLVVMAEWFVARHDRDFRHVWGWDWRLTSQAIDREAAGCELLCLGDSLVKFGVAPQVLEQRLGLRAYNLALSAGSPPAIYFVLRRALERGARPKAVLVDLVPHGIAGDLSGNRTVWPELLDVRDALDLAWNAHDWSLFGASMLGRILPSLRGRAMIREHVQLALRNEPRAARIASEFYIRDNRRNRGGCMVSESEAYRDNLAAFVPQLFPAAWRPRPLNVLYVRRFLDLAARHRIAVYWLVPPFAPDVRARLSQSGLDALYSQFLEGLQARYPNLTVIDGRPSGFDQAAYVDPLHLNRRGALAFTEGVAEVLARREPSSPRWVTLPVYREPSPDMLAELSGTRRVALRDSSARRH